MEEEECGDSVCFVLVKFVARSNTHRVPDRVPGGSVTHTGPSVFDRCIAFLDMHHDVWGTRTEFHNMGCWSPSCQHKIKPAMMVLGIYNRLLRIDSKMLFMIGCVQQ